MIMRNAALRNLPACPTRTLLADNNGKSCGKRKRKKAAPSLDMQDAHWLAGIGRVRKSVFGEGADKQTSLLLGQNTRHRSRILLSNCRHWYLFAPASSPH